MDQIQKIKDDAEQIIAACESGQCNLNKVERFMASGKALIHPSFFTDQEAAKLDAEIKARKAKKKEVERLEQAEAEAEAARVAAEAEAKEAAEKEAALEAELAAAKEITEDEYLTGEDEENE